MAIINPGVILVATISLDIKSIEYLPINILRRSLDFFSISLGESSLSA
ncbi:hypothetical protein X975_01211, partial [Stegodyphus mimosarum]